MPRDEVIKKDITDSIYWDTRVDASNTQVLVQDGIVTLSGTVPSFRARKAAESDAWFTTGVVEVRNQINVKNPLGLKQPTDVEITTKIETDLALDLDTYTSDIHVEVADGWVTLTGTVDTYWKLWTAIGYALATAGVIGVTNKVAVVPTDNRSDESIAESIIKAMDRNYNVNTQDITVKVENGYVTLLGKVPSFSAKNAAYDCAHYTAGVVDIDDQIIVSQQISSDDNATAPNQSKVTTNHARIKRWVEERGGKPAQVKDTASEDETGLLRIEFNDSRDNLEPISWEDFFRKFDEKNLAFLFQEKLEDGSTSRFSRFIAKSDEAN